MFPAISHQFFFLEKLGSSPQYTQRKKEGSLHPWCVCITGQTDQALHQNRCYFSLGWGKYWPPLSAQIEPAQERGAAMRGDFVMPWVWAERRWQTPLKPPAWLRLCGITAVSHTLLRTRGILAPLNCWLFACQSQMERCTSSWLDGCAKHGKMALKYKWVTCGVAEGDLVMLSAVQSVESKPSYWLTTFFLLP